MPIHFENEIRLGKAGVFITRPETPPPPPVDCFADTDWNLYDAFDWDDIDTNWNDCL
jgi:hypothetical protein